MAATVTHLYVAALLNAPAMTNRLVEHAGERLELICTGPGRRSSLIALYAAGYMVEHLMQARPDAWAFSDTALVARSVYLQYLGEPYRCLTDSYFELGPKPCTYKSIEIHLGPTPVSGLAAPSRSRTLKSRAFAWTNRARMRGHATD